MLSFNTTHNMDNQKLSRTDNIKEFFYDFEEHQFSFYKCNDDKPILYCHQRGGWGVKAVKNVTHSGYFVTCLGDMDYSHYYDTKRLEKIQTQLIDEHRALVEELGNDYHDYDGYDMEDILERLLKYKFQHVHSKTTMVDYDENNVKQGLCIITEVKNYYDKTTHKTERIMYSDGTIIARRIKTITYAIKEGVRINQMIIPDFLNCKTDESE